MRFLPAWFLILLFCPIGRAEIRSVVFSSGSSDVDGWTNISNANFSGYGSFPGFSPWPNPIGSNLEGSGDAVLNRIAGSPTGGGPFLSSSSIYFGNFFQNTNALGGTLRISDSTPLAGLQTVLFQIQIGEVVGYDFFSPSGYPVLKINGQTNGISASFPKLLVDRYQNGTFYSPETQLDEPVYVNTWAFQWNLTNPPSITSFAVDFSCVTHSQVYQLRVDQSSVLQSSQLIVSPPSLALLSTGSPQYYSQNNTTSMTHTFSATPGRSIDIEYSQDLTAPTWPIKTQITTGTGNFSVTFTESGDRRSAWSQRMFFRAKNSSN